MYIHDTPNSFPLKMKRNFIITFVVACWFCFTKLQPNQTKRKKKKHLISSKHAFSVSGINIFYRMVFYILFTAKNREKKTVGTIETHQTITT